MSRQLLCPKCGVIKPTHPEDAARGLFQRYVRGALLDISIVCDLCGIALKQGDRAVAVSMPASMGKWEPEYMSVDGDAGGR
jgi:hypothetical protein